MEARDRGLLQVLLQKILEQLKVLMALCMQNVWVVKLMITVLCFLGGIAGANAGSIQKCHSIFTIDTLNIYIVVETIFFSSVA